MVKSPFLFIQKSTMWKRASSENQMNPTPTLQSTIFSSKPLSKIFLRLAVQTLRNRRSWILYSNSFKLLFMILCVEYFQSQHFPVIFLTYDRVRVWITGILPMIDASSGSTFPAWSSFTLLANFANNFWLCMSPIL